MPYVKKVEEFKTAALRFFDEKTKLLDAVIRLAGEALRSHKKILVFGKGGGRLAPLADFLLDVPSISTPRIQEVHLLLLHIIAEGIENLLIK